MVTLKCLGACGADARVRSNYCQSCWDATIRDMRAAYSQSDPYAIFVWALSAAVLLILVTIIVIRTCA